MSKREVASNPPWALSYYKRAEANAYRTFMALAHLAGAECMVDLPAIEGWAHWQAIYRPIILAENTEGRPGPWELRLMEDVQQPVPDKAAMNLPFIVNPSITIVGENADLEFVRPALHVYCTSQVLPDVYLASTRNLGNYPIEGPLRNQARYITWLTMAEAQLLAD